MPKGYRNENEKNGDTAGVYHEIKSCSVRERRNNRRTRVSVFRRHDNLFYSLDKTHTHTQKNPFATLNPFCSFKKNGLDLKFVFMNGKDFKRNRSLTEFAFKTSKKALQNLYDDTEYGWDDLERKEEMCDPCVRFLFVYASDDAEKQEKPLGFLQFHITMQGALTGSMSGKPCVLVNDIHLLPCIQRKGVGTALLKLMSVVTVREKMSFMMIKVIQGANAMMNLINTKLKSFQVDDSAYERIGAEEDYEVHQESFTVHSRCVDKHILHARKEKENVQSLAQELAKKLGVGRVGV